MDEPKMRIIIVDDNKLFRDAIKLYLVNELNIDVVGEATNGKEFLALINNAFVDIVLMDIQMPELDGIAATKKWCLRNPGTKVIAVTMFTDKAYLLQLIEAGFKGCIFKTNFFAEIATAIAAIQKGGLYFASNIKVS
jgi:DNA-binding NarL/FixJ family response regulator